MHWIASLARVIGTAIPFGSVAVQISAEIESSRIQERLGKLEDPISALHPDVRDVSALIYRQLAESVMRKLSFQSMLWSSTGGF
jgi:hypothetical protein